MRYRILIILFAGVCFLMLSAHATPCRDHIRLAYLEAGASTRLVDYYEKTRKLRKSIYDLAKLLSDSTEKIDTVDNIFFSKAEKLVEELRLSGEQLYSVNDYIIKHHFMPNKANYQNEYDYEIGLISHGKARPWAEPHFIRYRDQTISLLAIIKGKTKHPWGPWVEVIMSKFYENVNYPLAEKFNLRAASRGEEGKPMINVTYWKLEEILYASPFPLDLDD